MELLVLRDRYTLKSTGGSLFINGQHFCETLEDPRRFPGVKISSETCIPAGRYKVDITRSTRFKRDMPIVYNCADGYTLKGEGITFTGILFHGGNNASHTAGCILIAYKSVDEDTIQGTAEKEVTQLIKTALLNREEVWLEVIDQPDEKT